MSASENVPPPRVLSIGQFSASIPRTLLSDRPLSGLEDGSVETLPPPSSPKVPGTSSPSLALLRQTASVEMLQAAWARVRANAGGAGGDGVTVSRFSFFAFEALQRLSRRLLDFTYRPGPVRTVEIPKRSGGFRRLDIPCVIDRIAQGAAALALTPILEQEMEDSSFAYRPGRGVQQAIRRIQTLRRDGFVHVVEADITRYFENVAHDLILTRLEKSVGDDAIIDLIALWLEAHATTGLGLPQGSPISPLLANLYLDHIDEAIESRGVRLVRYADDFVLLCKSEAAAESTLARTAALLELHGLALHPDKTRIVSFDRGFRFLGYLFIRSLVLKEIGDETPAEDVISAAEGLVTEAVDPSAAGTAQNPLPDKPHAPGHRILYLVEPGRRLHVEGEAFAVLENGMPILKLPHAHVDRIEIGPAGEASMAALDLAASTDVELCRVNGFGETVGRWENDFTMQARARRHLAQASHVLDSAKRLALAKTLVGGRIRSQRGLLRRINRDRKDANIAAAAAQLSGALRRLDRAQSIDQAMGWEGRAGAIYWPALARGLDVDIGAAKRIRRPAGSAFDCVLNALCALLERDVRVAIQRAGLHPGFSALHAPRDGEDALSYDLMEEFRAPLVEATALALVNRKALTPSMFARGDIGWRMGRDCWKAIIRGYEAACARGVESPRRRGKRVAWRMLMDDQALALAAHFEDRASYKPVEIPY